MSRFVKSYGDIRKGLLAQRNSSGELEHFRHLRQDMTPVMEHVQHTAQKVNEAPKSGNPNDWAYIGSIPMSILLDWLQENNVTIDAFARNDDGVKDRFKQWFLSNRDLNKFHANTHTVRRV